MKRAPAIAVAALLLSACAGNPDRQTLAELDHVEPDLREVAVGDSLDKALEGYRRFLEETPVNAKTPEAMRRMADLQIEQRYGVLGDGDGGAGAVADSAAAPSAAREKSAAQERTAAPPPERAAIAGDPTVAPQVSDTSIADHSEAQADFEARASAAQTLPFASAGDTGGSDASPRQAIETYKRILEEYPYYERNDQVLYQMARAYEELGEPDEAMTVVERLIREYPDSAYLDEVYFRRAEYFFVRRKYLDAEESYAAVIAMGEHSDFYELALYKLGWSYYKQELYGEALHRFIALLDYKAGEGYDFDRLHASLAAQQEDEGDAAAGSVEDEAAGPRQAGPRQAGPRQAADNAEKEDDRRVADTFRVISLAFSNLGGPEVLNQYFADNGHRAYENRIYSNLGEFYFAKLRYHDAATVYRSFSEQNPFHRVSPFFSMRVVEIYDEGGFAQLVVEAKKEFARRYALDADYWLHFEVAEAPEVRGFLKTNLRDLANHYHSLYQDEGLVDAQPENYAEALAWYRQYLASFPDDGETPAMHYQLADLLLEHEDFEAAALAYEHTAYDYPTHDKSAAAGYAAIFAHRQYLEVVDAEAMAGARLATVESSLKFADVFPDHEQAATVLDGAANDLYEMQDFERAIAAGRKLIDRYPDAEEPLRRSAWVVVAHSSMDLERFADAEQGYGEVLTLTPEEDERLPALYDNLAAAIYKQGEAAREQEDYALAAEHFLRISQVAPSSTIRPAAEYDAATALMKLEDWTGAAEVFRGFREAHPGHELQADVTKQLAYVYREAGDLAQSAAEYERVADGSDDPELRSESLLMAGDLYEDADENGRALDVFSRYVDEFPEPVDLALEIRFRMAGMHKDAGAMDLYHDQLRTIVAVDAAAGAGRTARTRYLAGKSALVLAEIDFGHFKELPLSLPFEKSLAEKKARMDAALAGFEALVEYEVPEVTSAATYYIAEIYANFGNALMSSERPTDLEPAELVEYNMALEGEAFPFEERSIDVHEKNMELMVAGRFDPWIQRSLDRLAVLMPGRYAKAEISSGFIGPVEVFAYTTPAAAVERLEPADVSARDRDESEETAADDGEGGGDALAGL